MAMSEEAESTIVPPEAQAAAMVLMSVRDDPGPFEKIGSRFSCNKVRWLGVAYSSPIAVYFLKKSRNTSGSYGGGLVGAMLSAALAKDDGLSTCTAGDLPPAIGKLVNPKGKLNGKDVVIVPKATVSMVKRSWGGNIKLSAGFDEFSLSSGLFGGKSKALVRQGWQLNTPLTPTVAPVHDMRAPEDRVVKSKPLWLKVLLIAGAIIILVLVIAARIAADLH